MMRHLTCLTIPLTILALAACSSEPETGPASVEVAEHDEALPPAQEQADASGDVQAILDDPDSLREAMRDPARREAVMQAMRERRAASVDHEGREDLRERMRERRSQTAEGTDAASMREQLRERRAERSAAWWEREDIIEAAELTEQQQQSLAQAQEALASARRTGRQELVEAHEAMIRAMQSGDSDRVNELLEQRTSASTALQQAEADWFRAALSTLNSDQLRLLAEQYPQLIASAPAPLGQRE